MFYVHFKECQANHFLSFVNTTLTSWWCEVNILSTCQNVRDKEVGSLPLSNFAYAMYHQLDTAFDKLCLIIFYRRIKPTFCNAFLMVCHCDWTRYFPRCKS